MQETRSSYNCLNCGRSESAIPLVALRFAGGEAWICSSCLPVLIHHPERLAGKLANTATMAPIGPPDQDDA